MPVGSEFVQTLSLMFIARCSLFSARCSDLLDESPSADHFPCIFSPDLLVHMIGSDSYLTHNITVTSPHKNSNLVIRVVLAH